ncbi:MAG TPA: hypothetical protein VK902_05380 [Rubrobacter sp.]|nr:hypothetical protein [Rubrobacter sp.]
MGTCVDVAGLGVRVRAKMLRVAQGSVMVFDYGGEIKPDSVRPEAYPIGRGNEVVEMEGFRLLRPSEGRSTWKREDLRVVRGAGDRREIPAELPLGDYIVEVFVRVPEGDVSYYFFVSVEEEAG